MNREMNIELIQATIDNNFGKVKELLLKGADIHYTDDDNPSSASETAFYNYEYEEDSDNRINVLLREWDMYGAFDSSCVEIKDMTQDQLDRNLVDATLIKDKNRAKTLIEFGADHSRSYEYLIDIYDGGSSFSIAFHQYLYDDTSDSTMYDLFEEWDTYEVFDISKMEIKDMNQNQLDRQLVDATLEKNIERAENLIQYGADARRKYDDLSDRYDGGTALSIAFSQYMYEDDRDSKMFDFFEDLEQKKEILSSDLNKVILFASEVGSLDKVKEALENGADIEGDYRKYKTTPLVNAVEMGHNDIAEYLLKNGANVNVYFMEREHVLLRAVLSKNNDLAKLLIKYGANVNDMSSLGRSVIGAAAQKGNLEILKILIEHDVDPLDKDDRGMTPLDYARKYEKKEVVDFLEAIEVDGI